MRSRVIMAAVAAGLMCIASQANAFERLDRMILNAVSGGGYGCGCESACGCDNGCHRGCHRDRCCRDRCHRDRCCHRNRCCDMGCDAKAPIQAPTCEAKGPACGYENACGCDRGCHRCHRDRCHRGCHNGCHRNRCGGCGCEAKCGCG